jgi:predicted methyltransferase
MRLTEIVQAHIQTRLSPGDTAIDATAGNGYDTVAMSQAVGPTGRVYAIDIQSEAIEATRHRLGDAHAVQNCQFLIGDHARELEILVQTLADKVHLITFNLGYLPGSDKSIQTNTASTLRALVAASELIKTNGSILITAYRGHDGGAQEAEAVKSWVESLSPSQWKSTTKEPKVSGSRIPPILYDLKKIPT